MRYSKLDLKRNLMEAKRIRNLLVAGNSTMPRSVGVFNLPALKTCLPSRWCEKHCYGLQGRFLWHSVKASHEWRYRESLKKRFVRKIVGEICRRPSIKFVRIHITGDFYSREYIKKWAIIARGVPHLTFRTNTKRIDFLEYMREVFPSNVVVRESTDCTRKHYGYYAQAAIIGTPGTSDFFTCVDDCEKCSFRCWDNRRINVVTSQIR